MSRDEMGKWDRKVVILRFLAETDMLLPPKAIHINMERRYKTITWSEVTTTRLLSELYDSGYVDKSSSDPRGYYYITDAGRSQLDISGSE